MAPGSVVRLFQRVQTFLRHTTSAGGDVPALAPSQHTAHGNISGHSTSLEDNPDISMKQYCHTTGPGFQFVSDLHLEKHFKDNEYAAFPIPRAAPYLILAGDIGRLCDKTALRSFLHQQCQVFEKVMLILGNHEFYGTSRSEGLRIADNLARNLGDKFVLMNRASLNLDDAVVLGCTLHSQIPENHEALTNDFQRIAGWRVADHNAEHAKDAAWLKLALAETHHAYPA